MLVVILTALNCSVCLFDPSYSPVNEKATVAPLDQSAPA